MANPTDNKKVEQVAGDPNANMGAAFSQAVKRIEALERKNAQLSSRLVEAEGRTKERVKHSIQRRDVLHGYWASPTGIMDAASEDDEMWKGYEQLADRYDPTDTTMRAHESKEFVVKQWRARLDKVLSPLVKRKLLSRIAVLEATIAKVPA